jgi:hypothetical protein
MHKIYAIWALLLALVCAIVGTPTQAAADNITFRVKSMAEQRAQIMFYSQDRRVHWPGGGQAYSLNDYSEHEFKLNCVTDEKICYGAWTTPNQRFTWGSGVDGRGSCSGCCYTCRGTRTELIVLRNTVQR